MIRELCLKYENLKGADKVAQVIDNLIEVLIN